MDLIEIDRLIAEKVMGFEVTKDGERVQDGKRFGIPSYSEKIEHAWLVAEKLGDEYGVCISNQGGWGCLIYDLDTETSYTAQGQVPLAICLAALKAVGVEVEE
ncbi:hypothetical protein [Siminovitchia sp. FSL W7-1587]|uniref:BC1872 family protein n=1 Tax=Siminovitchia sp. FSL W7-1587 TaxID=2954699 RepID=UPI0030D337C4